MSEIRSKVLLRPALLCLNDTAQGIKGPLLLIQPIRAQQYHDPTNQSTASTHESGPFCSLRLTCEVEEDRELEAPRVIIPGPGGLPTASLVWRRKGPDPAL